MTYEGIFDTHAHYDDVERFPNVFETLKKQEENGVRYIINCASGEESSARSIELAEACGIVYAAVGVHPENAGGLREGWLSRIAEMTKRDRVVAIGEIGLDYHYETPDRETQRTVFEAQLKLANELNLPVEIHDRDAHGDISELVRKYKPKGCIHRFSGSPEMAREMVKCGMSLGIGGALTYKNSKKEVATVAEIPIEYLLLETDCPYLAPAEFRGQTCTSDMIGAVARKISEIKGNITPEEVIAITRENAKRLFNIV